MKQKEYFQSLYKIFYIPFRATYMNARLLLNNKSYHIRK